jgi:hypothetical protein
MEVLGMRSTHVLCFATILAVALTTLASCALATNAGRAQVGQVTSTPAITVEGTPIPVNLTAEPSAEELAKAESELSSYHYTASWMSAESVEALVSGAKTIVVAKVTGTGPTFNSRRASEKPGAPASGDDYSIAQVYNLQVEQYLKGSGPQAINVMQHEGDLPGGMEPTAARLKVARSKADCVPIQVGGRYVFLLGPSLQVPELKNLEVHALATRLPQAFALSSDGNASPHGAQDPYLDRMFPKGPEQALIQRLQMVIAGTK